MKNFEDIVAEWTMKYKPMQHVPGVSSNNRRFFLIDSIMQLPQFMAEANVTQSPCVAYEFQQDGRISGGLIYPSYFLYFIVKVPSMNLTRKELANEAVKEAKVHALKFIAWLRREQEVRKELEHIELENVSYGTYGPFLNDWYAFYIRLDDIDRFNLCVESGDYVE